MIHKNLIRLSVASLLVAGGLAFATADRAEAAPISSVAVAQSPASLGWGVGVGFSIPGRRVVHHRPVVYSAPVVTYQQVPIYRPVFVGYDAYGNPIYQQAIVGYETVPVTHAMPVVRHGYVAPRPTVNVGFGYWRR